MWGLSAHSGVAAGITATGYPPGRMLLTYPAPASGLWRGNTAMRYPGRREPVFAQLTEVHTVSCALVPPSQ